MEDITDLYNSLKQKISESNKQGKDTSIIRLQSMSIPADIKLALAQNRPDKLDLIKTKIKTLIKNL